MKRASFFFALLLAACGGGGETAVNPAAGTPSGAAPTGDVAQVGIQYATQHGCAACHVVPGVQGAQGSLGPSLAGVGSRAAISGGRVQNTPENLAQYIQNPSAMDPQSSMPTLGIPPEHAKAIAAYLTTLK